MKHLTIRLDTNGDALMLVGKAEDFRALIAAAQQALTAITDGHPTVDDPRHSAEEHRVGSLQVACAVVEEQEFAR